jgi:predicted anti-sigma-YlaC factor YlaD
MAFPECQAMTRFVESAGDEPSSAQAAAIQAHVQSCELCRQQLQRCQLLARDLESTNGNAVVGAHLTEMDLAHYAALGARAPDPHRIISHLSWCSECRHQLAQTVIALREYEALTVMPSEDDSEAWGAQLKRAFTSPARSGMTIAAALVFLLECGSFALALALLAGAAIGGVESVRTAVGVWPFTEAVHPVWRLAIASALLMVAGMALRKLAALLFARATHEER